MDLKKRDNVWPEWVESIHGGGFFFFFHAGGELTSNIHQHLEMFSWENRFILFPKKIHQKAKKQKKKTANYFIFVSERLS